MAQDPTRGQLMLPDVDANYTVKVTQANLKVKPSTSGIIVAIITLFAIVAVIITAILIQ
ncbi:MAG: hypothetical protein JXA54_02950 [Candidatus Heimdallarchaeota archaeon]|nr:hypothetical protein [Candidatus Heimdallarchaeota archaeon]